MKLHFLITAAFIGCTAPISGAGLQFDTEIMAAQISGSPVLLQELETLSGVPKTTSLRDNSVKVLSILATLEPHELTKMSEIISKELRKKAPVASTSERTTAPESAPRTSSASVPTTKASPFLDGRKKYDLDGFGEVAQFKVAPLGDCGLLSLAINLSRVEATQRIERALAANRFDPEDAAYLRDQHHHLATEGQSLEHKHLKLIGLTLGFNVRFFADLDGTLFEAKDIRIKSKVPGLTDVLILDGEGHFEALIPTSNQAALQRAYETERTSKRKTAEFQRRYQ